MKLRVIKTIECDACVTGLGKCYGSHLSRCYPWGAVIKNDAADNGFEDRYPFGVAMRHGDRFMIKQ